MDAKKPVEKGEFMDILIEGIGKNGDGISRTGPTGYVIITPETENGKKYKVKIRKVTKFCCFGIKIKEIK